MKATIREATPRDATTIRDVHLASIEGLAGQAYREDLVDAWAHDRDPEDYPIESDDTYFVVAETDDRIVGFGWMKPTADEYFQTPVEGEITAVYVLPSVAGTGIGSRIYHDLEDYARRKHVTSLGLWASLNAVPFYEAMGYEKATTHVHEFRDGVEGTIVEMRKALD